MFADTCSPGRTALGCEAVATANQSFETAIGPSREVPSCVPAAALDRAAPGQVQMSDLHRAYRPDIDGLRAVAVVSVILFHASPHLVPGGFIGVDVFFVISGYLISGILFSKADSQGFSYLDFYTRRVKRIFPSLAVMLATTLCFGSVVLFAREFKSLGLQALSAAAFLSNIQFWYNSGYFDRQAVTKPLLHLWSLGVEEQFYLVWPPLILFAWRRKYLLHLMIGLALISFVFCVYATGHNAASAYFLPFSRFWELMLGALLAYANFRKFAFRALPPNVQSVTGLLLIVAGLFLFRSTSPFPGWRALLPTIGVCLLIQAGQSAVVNRTLLSNRGMVAIGMISYPLYLWHWPLLAYLYLMQGGVVTPAMTGTAILLAALIATVSYHLLEKPVRHNGAPGAVALVLASLLLLLGIIGSLIYYRQGLPARAINHLNVSDNVTPTLPTVAVDGCGLSPAERTGIALCQQDRREPATYGLLGDSKAQALFPALVENSAPGSRWLFVGGHDKRGVSPVPVLSSDPAYGDYQRVTQAAVEGLVRNPHLQAVVLASAARNLLQVDDRYLDDLPTSPHYAAATVGLDRVIAQLVAAQKRVVIVVDNPALEDPELCMTRQISPRWLNRGFHRADNSRCHLSLADQQAKTERYRNMLQSLAQRPGGEVTVVDPTELLCEAATKSCAISKDGHMLYSYSDHVSQYAAEGVARSIISAVMLPKQ